MASETATRGGDSAELALVGRGLRFAHAETEAAYREWRARNAMPQNRAAAFVGVFGVVVFASFALIVRPEGWALAAGVFSPIALLLVVASLALTYSSRHRHGQEVAGAIAASVIQSMLVGLFWAFDRPYWSLISVMSGLFHAFNVARRRPSWATASAIPFVALHEALVVRALRGGRLDVIAAGVCLFVPLSIFVRGVVTCIANERAFRTSYRQERIIDAQQREIEREHERAEALLHNILPATIAARLKLSPAMIADRFEDVTVLFADVVGFTPLATNVAPERLVGLLDDIFTRFDDLSLRLGVEKVKTIGDAYMAVAGLPEVRADHASVVAELALGMLAALGDYRSATGSAIELRIGIASGPVVAGVLGKRKFAYDLWGDTVNLAARMESHGVAGKIQVAESTYRHLKDRYRFEDRGPIEVKGKGEMPTWLLLGPPTAAL